MCSVTELPGEPVLYLGNLNLAGAGAEFDTGEPFMFMYTDMEDAYIGLLLGLEGTHEVSIVETLVVVHPFSTDRIPDIGCVKILKVSDYMTESIYGALTRTGVYNTQGFPSIDPRFLETAHDYHARGYALCVYDDIADYYLNITQFDIVEHCGIKYLNPTFTNTFITSEGVQVNTYKLNIDVDNPSQATIHYKATGRLITV